MKYLIVILILGCSILIKSPEEIIQTFRPISYKESLDSKLMLKVLKTRVRSYALELCESVEYPINISKSLKYKKDFRTLRHLLSISDKASIYKHKLRNRSPKKLTVEELNSIKESCSIFGQVISIR
jgi:hypothetical protein